MRTVKDARDVTAYLQHCSEARIAVDPSELWVQVSRLLEEAEAQGLIVDADVELVVSRMCGPGALDRRLFDDLRSVITGLILGRVAAAMPGYTSVDVSIVRGMVPHLAALVVKGGILEAGRILVLQDGIERTVLARVGSEVAEAAWRRRKSQFNRAGEVGAYIQLQRAAIVVARKELRWARRQDAGVAGDPDV
jgi:hypothetical protein